VTAAELLSDLIRQGFSITPDGAGIRVKPASRLTTELREAIRAHKAVLLGLLTDAKTSAAPRAWDQAEAERLLAQLREGITRFELTWPDGKFPPVMANILRIGVEVCEAYIRDHELEVARGWDALALLRDAVPRFLSLADSHNCNAGAEMLKPQRNAESEALSLDGAGAQKIAVVVN
jgi:hypothetical protein